MKYLLLIICNLIVKIGISQGVQVSPVKLYFSLNLGESNTQIVNVQNQSNQIKLYEVSLSDWYRDSLGDKVYAIPGTLENSCTNWVIVRPSILELKPNESKEIQVTLSRPNSNEINNNRAKCSMLFIKEIKEKQSITRPQENVDARMIVEYRLGVHIYQNPLNNLSKNVDIESFRYVLPKKEKSINLQKIEIKLSNNGTQISESNIKIILTNNLTGEEFNLEPSNVSMMPNTKRIVKIDIPKDLKQGNYSIVGIVDSGPEYELKIAELEMNL